MSNDDFPDGPLHITDPLDQLGLVLKIDSPNDVVSFINDYQSKSTIKCSIPGCGTPHKRGYTARTRDGKKALVGHICGKGFLKTSKFREYQRELDRRQERARREAYIQNPAFNPQQALADIATWATVIRTIEDRRRRFKETAPMLQKVLRQACLKEGGRLTAVKRVRNYAAEQTQAARGIKRDDPIYEDQIDVVHVVRGPLFLTADRPRMTYGDCKVSLNIVIKLQQKEHLTDAELERVVKEVAEVRQKLMRLADLIDDHHAFGHPQNLKGIAKWSKTHEEMLLCRAVEQKGSLLVINYYDERIEAISPLQTGKINRAPIDLLRLETQS